MNPIADLSFAARRLGRAPGFAFATVLMLALGIGLSVSMFSMLRGVLLVGLPYPGGTRVVSVNSENLKQEIKHSQLTPAEAVQLGDIGSSESSPFEQVGYYTWGGLTVFDGARPRESPIAIVSAGFFPALGMQPLHGHWFSAEEHGPKFASVVLSYREWQRLLGGRSDAIGEMIDSSEGRLKVIGVMPAEFAFPDQEVGAWLAGGRFNSMPPAAYQHARFIFAVGRLKPGLQTNAVNSRLDAVLTQVRERYGLPDDGLRLNTSALIEDLVGDLGGTLWSAFAIAVLVLLIACANVAIMFDARQIARAHEQVLAHALGASPARIRRTLLLELALLGGLGVLFGVLLAGLGLNGLRELARNSVPRADSIQLDSMVLYFAVALGVLAPFLIAAASALRGHSNSAAGLRGGAKRVLGNAAGVGVRKLLPALAIAFSTISLVAASAFAVSLMRLERVNPGFRSDNIHAVQLFRVGKPEAVLEFADGVRERMQALPGVSAVAITTAAPFSTNGSFAVDLQLEGHGEPEPYRAGLRRVSSNYLEVLGIPLLSGRNFDANDRSGAERVALISRELARRSFGTTSPIGQTIGLPLGQGNRVQFRVVGVMEDIRNDGMRTPPAPELLIPYAQSSWSSMTFLVTTHGAAAGLDAQMAEQVWAGDPRQSIARQFVLSDDIDSQFQTIRFFSRTVGAFALCALLLAALGVYAVAALQQRRRMNEFGLRLAIGARPASLGWQILRDGLRMVGLGAAFGLAGAWAALRLISAQTFGLETQLPWVMLGGTAVVALAALSALVLPALRAARTDPMVALRYE